MKSAPGPLHGLTRWRRWLWPLVQAALTLAVLWYVLGDPRMLTAMRRTLAGARPGWLVLGVAMGGVWIAATACRWRVFLKVQGIEMGRGRAWAITLIGMFFTLFLPGAFSADAARIYYAIRHRPDRKAGVVLSVFMDHIAGMVALMAIASITTFTRWEWFARSPVSADTMEAVLGFFAFTSLGLLTTFVAVETGRIHKLPQRTPGRAKIIESAQAIGRFGRAWRASLAGVAWSLPVLGGYFATFYCAARTFDSGVSLKDVFSIMPIVDVVSSLPITISGLGVREQLFTTLLGSLAAVPREMAILISLTGFACTATWSVAGGIVFPLYRSRRGWPQAETRK